MRAARLRSSMIERILFDESRGELTIRFRTGRRYVYAGVPEAVYQALRGAGSAGAYFNGFIRDRFPCREEGRRFRPV